MPAQAGGPELSYHKALTNSTTSVPNLKWVTHIEDFKNHPVARGGNPTFIVVADIERDDNKEHRRLLKLKLVVLQYGIPSRGGGPSPHGSTPTKVSQSRHPPPVLPSKHHGTQSVSLNQALWQWQSHRLRQKCQASLTLRQVTKQLSISLLMMNMNASWASACGGWKTH